MKILRFATLNIWNREGPWEERHRAIRDETLALSPDVLALSEVLALHTDGTRQTDAERIFEGLGWHFAFAAGHEVAEGLAFGNALVSPHPIRDEERIPLPGAEESDQERCLLTAVVETPLGPLRAFATHLNWKHHEGAIRLAQVRCIVDAIATRCLGHAELPPVLMGDFNDTPDSDPIRYLTGRAVVGGRSVHFADAWSWTNAEGPGYTFTPENAHAARLGEPARRVDYIFVRCDESGPRGKPESARVVFREHQNGVCPSDHFGVVAEVRYG